MINILRTPVTLEKIVTAEILGESLRFFLVIVILKEEKEKKIVLQKCLNETY